jgi:hypothetical protein
MSNFLDECLSHNDIFNCQFENIRAHNIDPRTIIRTNYYNSNNEKMKKFFDIITKLAHYPTEILYISLLKSFVIDNKELFSDDKLMTEILTFFTSYNKLNKNMKNIKNIKIKTYLEGYFVDRIRKYKTDGLFKYFSYDKLLNELSNIISALLIDNDKEKMTLYKNDYGMYIHEMFMIMVDFMDVYAISRLFRNYKESQVLYSGESKYTIFITGNAHTRNYYNILRDLKFKVLETNIKKDDGCIHDIIQPLFWDESLVNRI